MYNFYTCNLFFALIFIYLFYLGIDFKHNNRDYTQSLQWIFLNTVIKQKVNDNDDGYFNNCNNILGIDIKKTNNNLLIYFFYYYY